MQQSIAKFILVCCKGEISCGMGEMVCCKGEMLRGMGQLACGMANCGIIMHLAIFFQRLGSVKDAQALTV